MKNILIPIIIIAATSFANAQVVVDANANGAASAPSSPSVILEFNKTPGTRGIVLPYVEQLPTNAVGGTLVYDASAGSEYKVKVKNQNNSGTGWIDLSVASGYSAAVENQVKTPQAAPLQDKLPAKVIIGDQAAAASVEGVLVLQDSQKAMVLPKVSSINDVINPAPGMMVFVIGTSPTEHRLAVYNGQQWSFWAAK